MSPKFEPGAVIRQARPEDSEVCGQICYDAFSAINAAHGFPCDFPGPDAPKKLLAGLFSSPGHYCMVAERAGRIVGSNVVDERSVIAGVGPITVDPATQNSGVGRTLMEAALERSRKRGAVGVRLVQAAFHNRSLSLYADLGFDVREPLACMQGSSRDREFPGCAVRKATDDDAQACDDLSRRVHGFDRAGELAYCIRQGTAKVVERRGRVTGYVSALGFSGHGAAETNLDLQALIATAESFGGPGILVPMRNAALFRWCLASGLRVVQAMTLMSMGLYNEPSGAWFPSILY